MMNTNRNASIASKNKNHLPKKTHKFWSVWQFVIYLIIALMCGWAGVYNYVNVQELVKSISTYIPSIQSLSTIAPNQAKAAFELCLAWMFSLTSPVLHLRTINWDIMNQRFKDRGDPMVANIVGILMGLMFLAAFLYPITPSESRRGMLISNWFKLDIAYVWGCVVIFMMGFVWSGITACFVDIYRKLFNGSMNK